MKFNSILGSAQMGPDQKELYKNLIYLLIYLLSFNCALQFEGRQEWLQYQTILGTFIVCMHLYMAASNAGIILRQPRDTTRDEIDFVLPLIAENYLQSYRHKESVGLKLKNDWNTLQRGDQHIIKKCDTCILLRPPRTSHCNLCNFCVEKFDHHCPQINQCVGHNNYKSFLLYNLSLCVMSVSGITWIIWLGVGHIWGSMNQFLFVQQVICLVVLSPFTIFFNGLFINHIQLVMMDFTTHEYLKLFQNFRNKLKFSNAVKLFTKNYRKKQYEGELHDFKLDQVSSNLLSIQFAWNLGDKINEQKSELIETQNKLNNSGLSSCDTEPETDSGGVYKSTILEKIEYQIRNTDSNVTKNSFRIYTNEKTSELARFTSIDNSTQEKNESMVRDKIDTTYNQNKSEIDIKNELDNSVELEKILVDQIQDENKLENQILINNTNIDNEVSTRMPPSDSVVREEIKARHEVLNDGHEEIKCGSKKVSEDIYSMF